MRWTEEDVASSIPERFKLQVSRRGKHPAVAGTTLPLTYAELDELSDRYATALLAHGVTRRVALLLGHDGVQLAAALAALKCGSAVVTLNPSEPPARLAEIRASAEPEFLVTDEEHAELGAATGFEDAQTTIVSAEATGGRVGTARPNAGADDLAFLVCTSGSTGRPKVVMQSHRNLLHNVLRYTNGLDIQPDDRIAWLASLSGGQGLATAWTALLNGATLCPFPIAERGVTGLAAWLAEERMTVFDTIPSVLRSFARTLHGARVPGVRLVRIASEGALRTDFDLYRRHFSPDCALASVLASSEAGVIAQTIMVADDDPPDGPLSVGLAAEGIEVALLDDGGAPAAAGEAGEIVVEGRYLSSGYWRDDELTERRFTTSNGARRFRTGDLARRSAVGELMVLGRADRQVKVRGHRLQLEEVEGALARHDHVAGAYAEVTTTARGDARLTAYLTASAGHTLEIAELRRWLGTVLPAHAVPTAFVVVDEFPLTPTGKIDHDGLRALDPSAAAPGRPPADTPLSHTEELITGLWSDAFEREVDTSDAFLDLGGDSLTAAVIAAGIHDALGVDVDLRAFLSNPTAARLATLVDERRESSPERYLPPLRRAARTGPLSFAQLRFWKGRARTGDNASWNVVVPFDLRGPLDVEALRRSVERIVGRHEILRTNYREFDGRPTAVVRPPRGVEMPLEDLRPEPDQEARIADAVATEMGTPFDLAAGPLLRLRLLRLGDAHYRLLRTTDHMIHDAASWKIFFDELATTYEALVAGRTPPLGGQPALQYLDFAVWERGWARPGSKRFQSDLAWWRRTLSPPPPPLEKLPFLRSAPDESADRTQNVIRWGIPAEDRETLDRLGRAAGATYYMTRLALFSSLLAIETGSDDLALGMPISTRTRVELRDMIGPFINFSFLRLRFEGNPIFGDWLLTVRQAVVDLEPHVTFPWETILRELVGGGLQLPEITTAFVAWSSVLPMRFGGVELEPLLRPCPEPTRFRVGVNRAYDADRCWAEFDPRIHHPAGVKRFISRLKALAAAVGAEPDRPLRELHHEIARKSTWDKDYTGDPPAWEIGHPQPAIVALAEQGLLGGRMLDVGCGSGEHAILAAAGGAEALGVDISPVAIELARSKARVRGVGARFEVADALELDALGEVFDVVLDSGLFHTLHADRLSDYAASLARVVRPGGTVFITCISDGQSGDWGPRRVTRAEIEAAFGDGWALDDLTSVLREVRHPEVDVWQADAWLATIRRTADRRPSISRPRDSTTLGALLHAHTEAIARAGRSPLFVALIGPAAQDADAGGIVATAFDGVPYPPGSAPALRLFAALHHLVLTGRSPELAACFHSAVESGPSEDLWPTARSAIDAELEAVRSSLRRPVQTNEPGRAAALFGVLLRLALKHRLPVRVLEVGASAGLNLQADRFHYRVDGRPLGDPESPLTFDEPWRGAPVSDSAAAQRTLVVAGRGGCDRAPIDPADEAARFRLMSYVWPDEPARMARLEAAIEVARGSTVRVELGAAADWLAAALEHRREDELVVVWQSVVRPYLEAEERERLATVLATAGEVASPRKPLAHVELEAPGDAMEGLHLVARSWPGGESELLARCDISGPPVQWAV